MPGPKACLRIGITSSLSRLIIFVHTGLIKKSLRKHTKMVQPIYCTITGLLQIALIQPMPDIFMVIIHGQIILTVCRPGHFKTLKMPVDCRPKQIIPAKISFWPFQTLPDHWLL